MTSPDMFGASQLHLFDRWVFTAVMGFGQCKSSEARTGHVFDLGVDVVAFAAPGRFAESKGIVVGIL